jgi:hypothetical protein
VSSSCLPTGSEFPIGQRPNAIFGPGGDLVNTTTIVVIPGR